MGEARFVNEVTRPGRFTPRAVHHAQRLHQTYQNVFPSQRLRPSNSATACEQGAMTLKWVSNFEKLLRTSLFGREHLLHMRLSSQDSSSLVADLLFALLPGGVRSPKSNMSSEAMEACLAIRFAGASDAGREPGLFLVSNGSVALRILFRPEIDTIRHLFAA
jgi:hypothetical protein